MGSGRRWAICLRTAATVDDRHQKASSIALTTARANSEARRSSALTSWRRKALGVAGAADGRDVVLLAELHAGARPDHLVRLDVAQLEPGDQRQHEARRLLLLVERGRREVGRDDLAGEHRVHALRVRPHRPAAAPDQLGADAIGHALLDLVDARGVREERHADRPDRRRQERAAAGERVAAGRQARPRRVRRAGSGDDPSSRHDDADEARGAAGDHDLAHRLALEMPGDLRILSAAAAAPRPECRPRPSAGRAPCR